MEILEYVKNVVRYFFGSDVNLLNTLLLLQLFDVITGYINAIKNKDIKSNSFVNGIFKKILCITAIMVSSIIDNYMAFNGKIVTLSYTYFIFYEMLSIIENYDKLDIKVFNKIKSIIEENKKNKGL